jgi:hypothetical protein
MARYANFARISAFILMKNLIIIIASTATLVGCAAPIEMQVRVAPVGVEVPGSTAQYLYILPQTVLKVDVQYQEVRHIPGPYWEYARRYLGITEVIQQKASHWQVMDVKVTPHIEMDPGGAYLLNVLQGGFDRASLEPVFEKGVVLDGSGLVSTRIRNPALGSGSDREAVRYVDLGTESNFEERTETMYKTIVTDTSFVEVPVNRTIVEEKSLAKKAEEAAEFLLELRTRRFELLTGEYEGYPQGEAMVAALSKLDELEESYLSLFTGKTINKTEKRSWYIVPETGSSSSAYQLGMFSEQLGFVPDELREGDPLEVRIHPLGKTGVLDSYFSGKSDSTSVNLLYYRLPDVVNLEVVLGTNVLSSHRLSVYQSGAMVADPL